MPRTASHRNPKKAGKKPPYSSRKQRPPGRESQMAPAQPAELAPLYVFLASQEATYVTGEIYGEGLLIREVGSG